MTDDFEYDVAFSFTAQDETIATQLNDLISNRMKTFLYSERQREIAGTDGQEKFSDVYGKASRVVVVLYRPEWGETPWTRVEQTAIRQRAFENGWNFTTFIPTSPGAQMPKWLPRTRLYVGLERWGLQGAASVIDARVTEQGGLPRVERVAERAARFSRAAKLREEQKRFLNSANGVAAARGAYEELSVSLDALVSSLNNDGLALTLRRSNELRIVSGLTPINLIVSFYTNYGNVLEGSYLTADFYKGFPRIPGYFTFEKAVKLHRYRYSYEMVGLESFMYIAIDERSREFTPQSLGDHLLKTYMDVAEKNPLNY